MINYNFILFDWDGCLAKTLDIWLETYKQIFAEYGLYPEDSVITQQVFGDWNGPIKLGIKDLENFTQKLLAKVNEKYPQVQLYEGVTDVIETLKSKGKKIALVTTVKRSILQEALENNKLANSFDVILTAEDVIKHKPDPEIVNKALEILLGTKEETIIIGDSKSDLGAGQNAGVDSILFYPEHNELFYDLVDLKKYLPTYVIKDFKNILDVVG